MIHHTSSKFGVSVLKVLIVDDEPMITYLFSRYLESAGFVTAEAHSATAALDLLETFDADLLITDRQMDGMDGDGLIAAVSGLYPGLPTILVSGDNTGVYPPPKSSHFLPKPVAPSTLIDLTTMLIGRPTPT